MFRCPCVRSQRAGQIPRRCESRSRSKAACRRRGVEVVSLDTLTTTTARRPSSTAARVVASRGGLRNAYKAGFATAGATCVKPPATRK